MVLGPRFEAVLARAREGDELAWVALHQDLAGQLLGYLRGRGALEPEDELEEGVPVQNDTLIVVAPVVRAQRGPVRRATRP